MLPPAVPSAEDLVQRGRLARAGLADDAERLAAVQVEADTVDGSDPRRPAAEHDALWSARRSSPDRAPRPPPDRGATGARHHRRHTVDVGGAAAVHLVAADERPRCARRPPVAGRLGGATVVDRQRAAGANGQLGSRAFSARGDPGIGTSRVPCGASSRGGSQSCGVRHSAIRIEGGHEATSTACPAYITTARSANRRPRPDRG